MENDDYMPEHEDDHSDEPVVADPAPVAEEAAPEVEEAPAAPAPVQAEPVSGPFPSLPLPSGVVIR